jgi:hypothetical protein
MTFDEIMAPSHLAECTEEQIQDELRQIGVEIPVEQLRGVVMNATLNMTDLDRAVTVGRYRAYRHAPTSRDARRYGYKRHLESRDKTRRPAAQPPKVPKKVEIKHENAFLRDLEHKKALLQDPTVEQVPAPVEQVTPVLEQVPTPVEQVIPVVEQVPAPVEQVMPALEPTPEVTMPSVIEVGPADSVIPDPVFAPEPEVEGLAQVQAMAIPGFGVDGEKTQAAQQTLT